MDIVVAFEYFLHGEPLNTSFVLYGALIGAGEVTGFVLHILFATMLGIVFGLSISRVDSLKIDSFKKGIGVGLLAGLVTIPLGCIPFALIVGVPLIQMVRMVIAPHIAWGLVLGGLTGYLLLSRKDLIIE
jgi:ethanolamine transporter EutH